MFLSVILEAPIPSPRLETQNTVVFVLVDVFSTVKFLLVPPEFEPSKII